MSPKRPPDYVNYVIRIEVPFDTAEEAREEMDADLVGRFAEEVWEHFGDAATISGGIEPGYDDNGDRLA